MRRSAPIALALLALSCGRPAEIPGDPGPAYPVVEYVTEQEILTALPLRVRLPSRYGAERVLVFVHTWGSQEWDTLELSRAGQSWTGEVSCRAVSTVTGDTRYFFLALDGRGEPVVSSGSPEWPHVATIVGSLPDGPHGLTGDYKPVRCHDPADCPPDFPGCPAYTFVRPGCSSDDDCAGGGRCAWDNYCDAAPVAAVEVDADADEDERLDAAVRKATGLKRFASNAPRIRR